jgi:hypothetical protein
LTHCETIGTHRCGSCVHIESRCVILCFNTNPFASFIGLFQVVGEAYVNHPFFQVDRAEDWVAPAPFNTWMRLMQELEAERGRKVNRSEAGSIRSYTPGSSVAASPPRSRTMSLTGRSDRLSCSPRSRSSSVHPNSRCSYGTGSGFSSRAASPSTILAFDLDIPSMIQPLHVESPPAPPETTAIPQGTVTSKSCE